jgi:hypothetical protein
MPGERDPITELLGNAWESYIKSGDSSLMSELLSSRDSRLMQNCGHAREMDGGYPFVHRIGDMCVDGKWYRVARCTTCNERLWLLAIEAGLARPNQPGVPYAINSQELRYWAERENKSPAKAAVDWERIRRLANGLERPDDELMSSEKASIWIEQHVFGIKSPDSHE